MGIFLPLSMIALVIFLSFLLTMGLNQLHQIKLSDMAANLSIRKSIISTLDKGYDWVEKNPNHPLSKMVFLRISVTLMPRGVSAYFFSHPIAITLYMGFLVFFIYNNAKLGSLADRCACMMALNVSIYSVEHLGIAYSKLLLRKPNLRQHLYFGLHEPLTAEDEAVIRCTDKRISYPSFYGKSPISSTPWGIFFPPFGGKKPPSWDDKNKPKVPFRNMWRRVIQMAADNPTATSAIVRGNCLHCNRYGPEPHAAQRTSRAKHYPS
jgi:hypothetical protein